MKHLIHPRKSVLIGIGAGLLIALAVFLLFHQVGAVRDESVEAKTVVAFGDSLVKGFGATRDGGFVSILSDEAGVPIINAGKNGDTTESALARLETDALSFKASIVIVLLGGNDALRQVPIDETFRNLEEIIERIEDTGAEVLLVGVQGSAFTDPYLNEFNDLAESKDVEYVPDVLRGIWSQQSLMSDLIHPNDSGYGKMAEKIEPHLLKMLEEE